MATPSVAIQYLSNDYFRVHNTECSICHSADRATHPPETTVTPQIAPTSIVQTATCAHVFHELCLYTWVTTQLATRHATCPMCRHVLVHNPNTATTMLAEVSERLEALEREVEGVYEQMRRLWQMVPMEEGEEWFGVRS